MENTMTDKELVAKALSTPSGYAEIRLKMKLHPTHAKVLNSLFSKDNVRVSLLAGNSTGKTTSVVTAAVLYSIEIRNCLVVATSGVFRQITGQIMPALKKYSNLFPGWEFLENSISVGGIKKFIAFASDSEGMAQGWHSKPDQPLLVILDEAATIKMGLYSAIERCHPTYMLVTGSPLLSEGMFYDIETKAQFYKDYIHFKLPATECVESKGYWIKDKVLDDMINRWGREHPLVKSSVYAEFADNIEGAILSLSALEKCINNPPTYVPGPRCCGIDFGGGVAETAIYLRLGNRVTREDAFVLSDTMETVGRIVKCLKRLRYEIGLLDSEINADSDGIGLPMIDRLAEQGFKVNKFHGGSAAINDTEYRNLIAEAWINACRKIEKCELIIAPDDVELRLQLLSRQAKLNSSGKMQLEAKADMAARNVVSPDRADSFVMAVNGPISSGEITFASAYIPRRATTYMTF
jgi:hypothetical protein